MRNPVRVVLAGCGSISGAWLTALRDMPEVEIVGFVDLNERAARDRAVEFGWSDALIGSDLGTVLERTQPAAVFDCTVPEAHVAITLEALRHGCHVLGEKPMADTLTNARRMVTAAREAGRLYAVMQNYRYNPHIRRLCAFLRSDALGQVTTVTSDFFIGAHFGGFRDRMEHVLLLDMAIHTFDAARLIAGADPLAVTCTEWNPPGSWYEHAAASFPRTPSSPQSRGTRPARGTSTPPPPAPRSR